MREGEGGLWEGCEKDVVGVQKGSRRCTGGVWKVWSKADKDFSLNWMSLDKRHV